MDWPMVAIVLAGVVAGLVGVIGWLLGERRFLHHKPDILVQHNGEGYPRSAHPKSLTRPETIQDLKVKQRQYPWKRGPETIDAAGGFEIQAEEASPRRTLEDIAVQVQQRTSVSGDKARMAAKQIIAEASKRGMQP